MIVDIGIVAIKAFLVLFMVLNLAGVLGWIERKGSALIQDRIGANRASIFGFAGMGLINTLVADPLKFLTKEDFIPPAGDRFLHTLAPCLALFPALVTFAVIPFGDVPLYFCHDLFGRLRSRDRRLGIEQQIFPVGRRPWFGANDFLRSGAGSFRDRYSYGLRESRPSGDRAQPRHSDQRLAPGVMGVSQGRGGLAAGLGDLPATTGVLTFFYRGDC
jgi:hypothetical protein